VGEDVVIGIKRVVDIGLSRTRPQAPTCCGHQCRHGGQTGKSFYVRKPTVHGHSLLDTSRLMS